jgi:pentatricopeptide repeat protein
MAVRFKPSLDKFLKSQKNLSKRTKTPPRLWLDGQDEATETKNQGLPILKLTHPILHALESCTSIRQFNQVHTQLIVSGLFQHSLAASRVMKKLCSASVMVSHGVYVFDCLEEPDAFMCNTIMRSYVNFDDPCSALGFYHERMVGKWVVPNHYTFPLLVKVCAEIGSVREGEKTHARVVKFGFEADLFVRNSLIHLYSVCGRIGDARMVFDAGPDLDLVSWNTMIDGYVKNREVGVARELFDDMCESERDVFSWNSMIAGYVGIGDMKAAKSLFERMTCGDVVSWNCMIDGYARIGNVSVAREFFDRMPLQNVVSWNIMLALCVRCKHYSECLTLFDMMIDGGEVKPNEATLVSVLTACANLGRLERGNWVHSYLKNNRIKPDLLLSTALLTMYAKCGAMDLARDVFDEMPNRSVVSWNSMIMGYGMQGNAEKALEMFVQMEKRGPKPNDATFTCVLSACTHAGMVLEGWWCFDLMCRVYKIEPKVEHYGCMVDLLARAGLMKDSEEIISKMPMESGSALWGALLSACRTHSNSELGEIVAKRLIELEPRDIGPYVLLSNIYAAEGKWDDVEYVRRMMKERGLQKASGSSLVHLGEFESKSFVGNGSVHQRSMVYSMLSEMGAQMKLSCRDSKMV